MGLRRTPAALLWPGLPLLYLLAPGHPLGLFAGLPLSMPAAGLALAVGLLAWCRLGPTGSSRRLLGLGLAAALALKLVLAAAALPYGLAAEYRSGDHGGPLERSTEWRIDGATRVDRSLELVGDQFPVHFLNDLRRFNYFRASEPRRDLLPFAVTWRGWLMVPSDGQTCLRLHANGGATLSFGGLTLPPIQRSDRVELRESCGSLQAGVQPIELRYSRPADGAPYLRLTELVNDGDELGLDRARLLRTPVEPATWQLDRWLGRVATALDAAVALAVLAVGLGAMLQALRSDRRSTASWAAGDRPILALALLAAFGEALATHRHFAGRALIPSGGNDWLAYASFARDVLLNGPLMNGGRPLGQGETFYYQPLYSYFLAGLHALLGESLHGVLVTQYVLMALSGVLTFFLARELFGQPAAWAAFGLFWALRYLVFNPTTELLLSENLVCVLVPPMLLLLARWQRTWRRGDLVGGGVLLGLAILTRSTPLLFLPPTMLLVGLAQLRKFGQRRAALGAAGLLFVVTMAITSLVAVRNYAVAGRPALLPESTSANLWEAHRPSPRVDLRRIDRDPLYNRLGLDRQTREVLEFARQDPLGYGWTLAQMGLYAVGVTGPALGTSQMQYELIALTALYLAAVAFIPAARRQPAWLVHAFVATHFGQMMIFMSHQYGFRLPLPMYAPMVAVAGVALAAMLCRLTAIVSPPSVRLSSARASLAATAGVLLAGAWSLHQTALPAPPEARVFGLGGDAGRAARAASVSGAAWRADRLFFTGSDRRSLGVAYLTGLAYRDMKWIDTSQALAWPSEGKRGALLVPEGPPTRLMGECWDPQALRPEALGPATAGWMALPIPTAGERRCAVGDRRKAAFGGLVELTEARIIGRQSGQAELRVAWRVIHPPGFRARLVVERLEGSGAVLASATADPYPAARWEPGELVVARMTLPTPEGDPSRLAVGFARGEGADRLPIDDPLPLYGQVRVTVDE